jgi:O-antigen/teichoic acid export membrane protein
LGKEQYGLIGSFVVLQACIQILDAGVSGTLTRQSLVTQSNYKSFRIFIGKAAYLCLLFVCIGLGVALIGYFLSDSFSTAWFISSLDTHTLATSTALMFFIAATRLAQGPLRSLMLSFEKHKLISALDIIYTTLNGPVILLVLTYSNSDIVDYFRMQLVVILFSTLLLMYFTTKEAGNTLRRLMVISHQGETIRTDIIELFKFGLKLSLLSILWIVVNQSDKITLTKFMELSEYSFYAVSISVVGMLSIFTATMIQTVRPRFVVLYNTNDDKAMINLLNRASVGLMSVLTPLVVFTICFGSELLLIWTGNNELAAKAMDYIPFLLLGVYFVSLSEFCFIILYSSGELSSHTKFYSLASMIIIPLNIFIASHYQGVGSARLFMLVNLFIFLSWSLFNIGKYFKGSPKTMIVNIVISFSISILLSQVSRVILGKLTLYNIPLLTLLGLLSILLTHWALNKTLTRFDIKFRMRSVK